MGKTILTVDDSASIRQMVKFTLAKEGYNVVEACDGKDALSKAGSASIDMVVTDLNMPNMDGITLIKESCAQPKFKFIPIIMLTTESQDTKKAEGKSAGATGWIVKPFKPELTDYSNQKVLR